VQAALSGAPHVATASFSTCMFSLARSGWLTATGPSIRATVTLGDAQQWLNRLDLERGAQAGRIPARSCAG
jgi:hypothetical protein